MYNTIYPAYTKPYAAGKNQIVKRKEDEEQSQSSSYAKESQKEYQRQSQDSFSRSQFPNGEQVSIDYSKPTVNIAQIVTDFKNTTSAIGAPQEISDEVSSYLKLIELQAEKNEPNKKIIQSNLKNASQILDGYITKTLEKPSKVVENWIDALFLQSIDYKSDATSINPEFQVKLPEKKVAEENIIETAVEQPPEEETTLIPKSGIYIPEDKQLRKMFIQAKKYSAINDSEKALTAFKNTLDYAKKVDDKQAQSMVYYEAGQIYDKNDLLSQALSSYNKAIETTQDENIKIKSHISMAQIYDDVVEFEPAVDHYFAAISFSGENENLNAQTKALSNLANMFCNRYDKQNTFEYIDLATSIAKETQNDKTIGAVYSKSADMSERLDENFQALQLYKESTKFYTKADSTENIVKNYQKAANIMLELGDNNKARNLLVKAYAKSQSLQNTDLLSQITTQLSLL